MEIQPPKSSPKGGRPRKKNPRTHRNFQHNGSQNQAHQPRPPQNQMFSPQSYQNDERRRINRSTSSTCRSSRFYSELKSSIDANLSYARNDSDRIFAYKLAFDKLIQEFQQCRPILERIKKNYDEVSTELLYKKSNIRVDSSSTNEITQDTFDEIVNTMKRTKEIEVKQFENKADELLEKMTQLRVQKSQLSRELNNVESRREDMKLIDQRQLQKISEAQNKILQNSTEIKIKKNEISAIQEIIQKLEEKLSESQSSYHELFEQDQTLEKELNDLLTTEKRNSETLESILKEQNEIDTKIANLENENWELQKQNRLIEQKYEDIKKRKENSATKIRKILQNYDDNIEDPIIDIIQRLAKK